MNYELLKLSGLITENSQANFVKIEGGLNSNIQLVEIKNYKYIFKQYSNVNNAWPRLETEFNFLTLLSEAKVRNVPKAIKKLEDFNIGIYSYLEGKSINEPTDHNVGSSASFIIEINNKIKSLKKKVKLASDYFSDYEGLLSSIHRRIFSLRKYVPIHNDAYSRAISEFEQTFNNIVKEDNLISKEIRDDIFKVGEVISPSDFGFHNILQDGDSLKFLDFEYAGTDNVFKLLCDFYCQPRIPISGRQFKKFVNIINENLVQVDGLYKASVRLMPIFRLKWACIILNQINKLEQNRQAKNEQIEKALTYLSKKCEE